MTDVNNGFTAFYQKLRTKQNWNMNFLTQRSVNFFPSTQNIFQSVCYQLKALLYMPMTYSLAKEP